MYDEDRPRALGNARLNGLGIGNYILGGTNRAISFCQNQLPAFFAYFDILRRKLHRHVWARPYDRPHMPIQQKLAVVGRFSDVSLIGVPTTAKKLLDVWSNIQRGFAKKPRLNVPLESLTKQKARTACEKNNRGASKASTLDPLPSRNTRTRQPRTAPTSRLPWARHPLARESEVAKHQKTTLAGGASNKPCGGQTKPEISTF